MTRNAMRRFALAAIIVACAGSLFAGTAADPSPLPNRLHETGLYVDGTTTVRADNLAFSPQYPLWSDGATKRRWIHLPPGTAIDASRPDAWDFPPGTRLWKEFSHGRPVETRFIERLADGSWRFATYAWNAQGTEAVLVPSDGARLQIPHAPGGRYRIPSRADCLACHEGAAVPVLGFSALQLSTDRDPRAAHAERKRDDHADLAMLVARGLVRNLPIGTRPRIAAQSATSRAALGYLHANCGHCHNDTGGLPGVDLTLAQQAGASQQSAEVTLRSLFQSSRFRAPGTAGDRHGLIVQRMQSTSSLVRMPPVGVEVVDRDGVALLKQWIEHELTNPEEQKP